MSEPADGGAIGDRGLGAPAGAGLCGACLYRRVVVSGKGSRFVLCERSRTDPRYAKYPPLPVVRCEGFEADPKASR